MSRARALITAISLLVPGLASAQPSPERATDGSVGPPPAYWAPPQAGPASDAGATPPASEPLADGEPLDPYGFSFGVAVGAAVRALYSIPIGAVQAEWQLGARTPAGTFGAAVGGLVGSTEHGLSVAQIYVAPGWTIGIDRLRLGAQAPIGGWLGVHRTTQDAWMSALPMGFWGIIGVDAVQSGPWAMPVTLRAGVEGLVGSGNGADGPYWGASLLVGVRRD